MTKSLVRSLSSPFPHSTLYLPEGQEPRGGVVVLHGSEGGGPGYHAAMAEFLARNGYAALAFTWCAATGGSIPGVPPDAIDVDIENTVQAIRWLQGCPEMNGKKTGLYGVSRGAELALLVASMQQNQLLLSLHAVAVHASSDRVMPGWSSSYPPGFLSRSQAFRWGGQPLETFRPIEVENFAGPVFLSHGIEDREYGEGWYVQRSQALEARLMNRSADSVVEAHYLPNERHQLSKAGFRLHQKQLLAFFERYLQ